MNRFIWEIEDLKITSMTNKTRGGPGSGNFDHPGRPGLVGGSGSTLSTIGENSYLKRTDDHKTWASSLSSEQCELIESYKSTIYEPVNEFLRHGTELPEDEGVSREDVKLLVQIINEAKLPENLTVYRGITFGSKAEYDDFLYNYRTGILPQPGYAARTFIDKGLVSTSLDPYMMDAFNGENSVIFKISAPAGSRGAYIGYSAGEDTLDFASSHMGQEEVLLGTDTKFKVTNASFPGTPLPSGTKAASLRTKIIDLEILP